MRHGDGWQGWASKAPFDGIIVTAAASSMPMALLQQLTDGGVMVIPVGTTTQRLIVVRRFGDEFEQKELGEVKFVPLVPGATT